MYCVLSDNKKGSTPSERTLKGKGSCWPNASRPPWPRLHRQVWSKTNAKARPMEQKVKRMMLLIINLPFYTNCCLPAYMVEVSLMRLVWFSHRLSQAEYHEQEEIFKLRLGHLKKVMHGILRGKLLVPTFLCVCVHSCFVNCPVFPINFVAFCRKRLRSRRSWRGWSECETCTFVS